MLILTNTARIKIRNVAADGTIKKITLHTHQRLSKVDDIFSPIRNT